jgi:hypothetical protein
MNGSSAAPRILDRVRETSTRPVVDIKNRLGERLWRLLRKVVARIPHNTVLMASSEAL